MLRLSRYRFTFCAQDPVNLPPTSLALLSVFARRQIVHQAPLNAPFKEVPDKAWATHFLHEYRQIKGAVADTEATEQALCRGMDGGYFSSCKSKLHRELKDALGPSAKDYLISDGGTRPRQYSLTLPAGVIRYRAFDDCEAA